MNIRPPVASLVALAALCLWLAGPVSADQHEGTGGAAADAAAAGGDDAGVMVTEDDLDAIEAVEEPEVRDEIVVQGRRREELLQSTPLSIRAFDATELEERSITRVDEIGIATANLKFDTTTGTNTDARIYIRGVGQDDNRTLVDPGVAVYIDDVYLPRLNAGLFQLVDIQQIEVLRGPQGTLFGKNTVGGVINVRTSRPGPDFASRAGFRVGNLGMFETNLSVDIPLSFGPFEDRVFTRLSFASAQDDGWLTNLAEAFNGEVDPMSLDPVQTGADANGGDNKYIGGRLAIFAQPTDDLEIDITADFSREPERQRFGECNRTNPFNLGRLVVDNFTRFQAECDSTQEIARDYNGYALPIQKSTPDTYGLLFRPTYHINDEWQIKSITSWRRRDTENVSSELDWTPTKFLGGRPSEDQHDAYSQEIQLAGELLEGDLHLTTGFFFFMEEGETTTEGDILRPFTPFRPLSNASVFGDETTNPCANVTPFVDTNGDMTIDGDDIVAGDLNGDGISNQFDTILRPNCTLTSFDPFLSTTPTPLRARGFLGFNDGSAVDFDQIVGNALCAFAESQMDPEVCLPSAAASSGFGAIGPFPFQRGIANLNNHQFVRFENQSYAGYGQASYQLLDDVELTVGARYTFEKKKRSGTLTPVFPCGYVPDPSVPAAGGVTREGCPMRQEAYDLVDTDGDGIADVDVNGDLAFSNLNMGETEDFETAVFVRPTQQGIDQERSSGSFTPLIQIGWQATEDLYVYGQWTQGFKSGGFDEVILTPEELEDRIEAGSADLLEFDDEKSNSFEAGVKTQWWDKRVTANLTGYVNLYDDIQLTVIGLNANGILAARIVNAGEATIAGFEAEFLADIREEWIPGKNARLVLGAGIGYTNASFTSFDTFEVVPVSVRVFCDLATAQDPRLCQPGSTETAMLEDPNTGNVIEREFQRVGIDELCISLKFEDCIPGGTENPATTQIVNNPFLGEATQITDDGGLPLTFVSEDPVDGSLTTDTPLAAGGAIGLTPVLSALINPEVEPIQRKNLDFKNTPEWDMNFSGTYFTDVSDWGTASIRADYAFQSSVFYNTDNTLGEEAYGLLNGRIAFQTDRIFEVDLTTAFFVRNVFDFRYQDSGIDLGVGIGVDSLFYAQPRRYGFEMTARY